MQNNLLTSRNIQKGKHRVSVKLQKANKQQDSVIHLSPDQLEKKLDELSQAIAGNKFKAPGIFQSLRASLTGRIDARTLDNLSSLLERYEYNKAKEIFENLREQI